MLATLFAAAVAIAGVTAMPAEDRSVELVKRADVNDDSSTVKCEFNAVHGPSLLVAVVTPPGKKGEIGAWGYGRQWCTSYNKLSGGTNICGKQQEWLHVPLSTKEGEPVTQGGKSCYANVYAVWSGCGEQGHLYDEVKVTFQDKDDLDHYVQYNCVPEREYRGCTYDGSKSSDYTSILACGIIASE